MSKLLRVFFFTVLGSFIIFSTLSGCSDKSAKKLTIVRLNVVRQEMSQNAGLSAKPMIDPSAHPIVGVRIIVTAPDLPPTFFDFPPEDIVANNGVVELQVPTGEARTFDVDLYEFVTGSPGSFPIVNYGVITAIEDRTVDLVGEPVILNLEMTPSPTVNMTGVISDARTGAFLPLMPCASPSVGMTVRLGEFLEWAVSVPVQPDGSYTITGVPTNRQYDIVASDSATGASQWQAVGIMDANVSVDWSLVGAGPLEVSPSAVNINPGGTQLFVVSKGAPPYTFSITANLSNGWIAADGTYTAGPTMAVTDAIQVTDACYLGPADTYSIATATATINLITQCNDGVDNDGDTFTDFPADTGCAFDTEGSELDPTIACDNGTDDDGDTFVDFPDDPGCGSIVDTSEHGLDICDDGINNDSDGLVDMLDPGCTGPTDTSENNPAIQCDDGINNDLDALVDMNDPGCATATDTSELNVAIECDDGIDNVSDNDILADMNDPGCSAPTDASELNASVQCDDGLDNDGWGDVDSSDTGCASPADASEYNPAAPCDDGISNDFDGLVDVNDPGCTILGDPDETNPLVHCDNGWDDDSNGQTDWPADTKCSSVTDINERNVWFVSLAGSDTNPGFFWGAGYAFATIQHAVDTAASGDQVWVSLGTYSTGTATPVVVMKDGVSVYGGFAGGEVSLANRLYPWGQPTILDGLNLSSPVVAGASNTTLDGFTLTGGNAPVVGSGYNASSLSNITVNKCIFTANYGGYGGTIYIESVTGATISNSIFYNNTGGTGGGGIYFWGGSGGLVSNTLVYGNSVSNIGGGIFNQYSSPTIINSTIVGNGTSLYGGGVYNYSSNPVIINSIIWGNSAPTGANMFDDISTSTVTYSNIGGGWAGTGNINTDPLIIGGGNYKLKAESPCIDSAGAASASTDILGNPRVLGLAADMGAYEWTPDYYVDDTATGLNDGSSWANAFTTIQQAINAAFSGQTVFVAQGNYATGTTATVVTMKNGVDVYGGFAGTEQTLKQRLDPMTTVSTVNGMGVTRHVVAGASNTKLDGFKITGANANGAYPDDRGGGLDYIGASNAIVSNCLIQSNSAASMGSGMYNGGGGNVTISKCTFDSNSNGGFYQVGSTATIINSIFSNNTAIGFGNTWTSTATVSNSLFINNTATQYGGAIANFNGSVLTVTDSTFSGNFAAASGESIGNYFSNGTPSATIARSVFWGNTGPGANIYDQAGTVSVTYSDVEGGYAGTGNINLDPLFIGVGNYRLKPESPCVDATNNNSGTADLDNKPRVVGVWQDMGAYEWRADVYVDDTATGLNNGTSWADAFTNLQTGVNAASSGQNVIVAAGTYATGTTASVLTMNSGVSVYGGFNPSEYTLVQRSSPFDNQSILDGMNVTNSVVWGASNATLNGFVVKRGNTPNSSAGIEASGTTNLLVESCIFDSNVAAWYGGVSAPTSSTGLVFNNCLMINNQASWGGAMWIDMNSVTVTNSTINGNYATTWGGGIVNYVNSANGVFTNNIFWGNTDASAPSTYNFVWYSSPAVSYCNVEGGAAGTAMINADPLFVTGPLGNFYLSQTAAGQGQNSPSLDTGSAAASILGMGNKTTRTDGVFDAGIVDMGFHY